MKRSLISGLGILCMLAIPVLAEDPPMVPDTEREEAPSVAKDGKMLWARSCLWGKAPEFVVEKWLTEKPDMEGKYLLIEFWATWCSACLRAQPLMNRFQEKFGDELVIIGISDEKEEKIRPYIEKKSVKYAMAIDTQARMKDELEVYGIPHAILVEPGGHVIWEGYPEQKGYELTAATIEKILAIGRAQKKAADK